MFGIQRVLIEIVGGETRHVVADAEALDALAHRQHLARHLAAEPGGQTRMARRQVLSPEHVVPAHADGAHADQDLARAGNRHRALFLTQHVGRAELMKTDDAGHCDPSLTTVQTDSIVSIVTTPASDADSHR